MPKPIIRIAAALLVGADGRTLLVRKRGTRAFMQPGGKIEVGEASAQALARELAEELGLAADPVTFVYLGRFIAEAAIDLELAPLTRNSILPLWRANETAAAGASAAAIKNPIRPRRGERAG